jgi:hypothetical protein
MKDYSVTITHTWQGFVVGGGGLPREAAWEIFDNYDAARQYAMELAYDLDLPMDDKVPASRAYDTMAYLQPGALMRRQAE